MHETGKVLDLICGDVAGGGSAGAIDRPWIGVQFECCALYARVYRRTDTHFYVVKCPKCGRKTTVRVDPGGVTSRLFRVVS